MKLSVVIPNYNGEKWMLKCLSHLESGLKIVSESEVYIIDNGSSDGSIEVIRPILGKKNHHLIKNKKNLGFARAVNQAAIQAQGELILILNNDCLVASDTIEKLLATMKKYPKYVATQPVVKKGKVIENIGYLVDTWQGRAKVISDTNLLKELDKRYIYGLSATCLLIKKSVFTNVGMFDEKFHSYLEDVDLFLRLHKQGYQYGATIDATCQHEHMATSSKMGSYKQKRDLLNWIRIILKNFSLGHILQHLQILLVERLRNLSGLLKAVIIKGL